MELFADRFLLVDGHTAVDLATGEPVALTIAPAGGAREQGLWTEACDAAECAHHPAVPRLIDFGAVGTSHRFEARDRSVERPAAAARDVPSLTIVRRPAVTAIAELFEWPEDRRPFTVAIWGPRGAGKHTIVLALARTARRHGFVPVAAPLIGSVADALRGRSLFVIDEDDRRSGWSAWLRSATETPRPHVLLVVSIEEPFIAHGVAVEPLSVDVLVGAVRPAAASAKRLAALHRAARASRGWPGRFARLLWRLPDPGRLPSSLPVAMRAAEQPVVYGVEEPAATVAGGGSAVYAPSSDAATWRRRAELGARLAVDGRHAAAERTLRQAIGALTRRHDWAAAGQGGLALAALLLRRGRPRDAHDVLRAAGDVWQRAGDQAGLIDVAVSSGVASIELARLDHAETTLSAAVASARSLGDQARTCRAGAALARALFWSARYDEADATMKSIGAAREPGTTGAFADLEVAIAVGQGDFSRAVARGTELLASAQQHGEPRQVAVAACRAAFAHLAVGDAAAVDRDTAASIAAARLCREPLLAARSRLVLAEALRRAGRQAVATRVLARVGRLGSRRLPPIVHARWELLRELLAPAREPLEIVRRHVAATGLGALALYAPEALPGRQSKAVDPAIDRLVEILDLCQSCEDETTVLTEVCRRARAHLHAAATAIVARRRDVPSVLAADGRGVDPDTAARAMAAGIAIAPIRGGARLEAAAPIRYGGTAVGAVVARWPVATPYDLAPAASLMAAIAAAAAPIVAAALARGERTESPALAALLGSSAAMDEVRDGIERAAAAPFAVLVEGESGTGKELVARALHRHGPRRDRVFRTLNCAALPDELVETELFGHARGAFTGAAGERIGVFEEASGGTLFLDEIGELSPRAQAKVLRVIQEGELRRVGENVSRRIDVRIVSATNRDLRREVAAGRFRLDLLYRLDVVRISVPPLRDRRDDIPGLVEHFWRDAAARVGSRAALSAAALALLVRYDWPGNIRELQNALASLVVRSPRRGVIAPGALGPQFADSRLEEAMRLDAARRTFEERFVRAALVRAGGHRARAAAELGLTRQGLTKLVARLGIRDRA